MDEGKCLEPFEGVEIELDEGHPGMVVEKMGERKGELTEMRPSGAAGCASVPCADARPDRVSEQALDRYARDRGHEPPVPRLGPTLQRRDRGAGTEY